MCEQFALVIGAWSALMVNFEDTASSSSLSIAIRIRIHDFPNNVELAQGKDVLLAMNTSCLYQVGQATLSLPRLQRIQFEQQPHQQLTCDPKYGEMVSPESNGLDVADVNTKPRLLERVVRWM